MTTTEFSYEFTITALDLPDNITVEAWSTNKGHLRVLIEGGADEMYSLKDAERIVAGITGVIKRAKDAHQKTHGVSP